MPWVGLWGSLDALGTVLGRSEGIWGCLGVVLGASSGGLDVIWGAFGMCLGDFGISQRGKKGSQEQLKKNTLTFDKSCSRVGASMVFRGRSVPGGIQNPSNSIPGGVGECIEGQIGGKSGPGALRMRQRGQEGALGRVIVGTQNLSPPPHPCLALISRPHPSRANLLNPRA